MISHQFQATVDLASIYRDKAGRQEIRAVSMSQSFLLPHEHVMHWMKEMRMEQVCQAARKEKEMALHYQNICACIAYSAGC